MLQEPGHCQLSDQSVPPPVFLLAPARSCSTVALALLAGHPDIYGFPEMLLFTADTIAELIADQPPPPWARSRPAWVIRYRRSGILRAVADLLEGSQDSAAIVRARRWLNERSTWSPMRLMNHLLALARPRIGLEKSPETVASDRALDACLRNYPGARYIHLTRHPVATQRSMQQHWRSFYPSQKALIAAAASSWYLGHSRIARKLAPLPADQWIRVRAEDVVGAPEVWLPRILDWLELPSGQHLISQMTHTENWRFAGTGSSGDLFGGDPKFMRSPVLRPLPDPGGLCFEESWALPDEMCDRMQTLASFLGYS
jgi:hypothetical protein